MIQKPTIIISSGGRTGTTFFARLLNERLNGCLALHEPGAVKWKTMDNLGWTIKKFGFWNVFLHKAFGNWGVSSISNKRLSGKLSKEEAIAKLHKERGPFIDNLDCTLYAESSYQFYGVMDLLPQVFANLNIIYIVRHGYDWVRSHMNKKDWYAPGDLHARLGIRLVPTTRDGHFYDNWARMSQFEKVCWSWLKINSTAIQGLADLPRARVYRFEDVFLADDRYQRIEELLTFATKFPDKKLPIPSLDGVLEKRVNRPPNYDFPAWPDLPVKQKEMFKNICGPLMQELGYSDEGNKAKFP